MARHEAFMGTSEVICPWPPAVDAREEVQVVNGALVALTAMVQARVANPPVFPEVKAAIAAVERILAHVEPVVSFDPRVMAAIEAAMKEPLLTDSEIFEIDEEARLKNIDKEFFVPGC